MHVVDDMMIGRVTDSINSDTTLHSLPDSLTHCDAAAAAAAAAVTVAVSVPTLSNRMATYTIALAFPLQFVSSTSWLMQGTSQRIFSRAEVRIYNAYTP
jgi:hypothetical protein